MNKAHIPQTDSVQLYCGRKGTDAEMSGQLSLNEWVNMNMAKGTDGGGIYQPPPLVMTCHIAYMR